MLTLQRLLNVIWPYITDGCNLTRETEDSIRKAGFSKVECLRFDAVWAHIMGYAEVNY